MAHQGSRCLKEPELFCNFKGFLLKRAGHAEMMPLFLWNFSGPRASCKSICYSLFLIAASTHSVSQGIKRCFASQKQLGKNRFHWNHAHSGFQITDMWNLGQRKDWESSAAETGTVICTVNWLQLSLAILLFSIVIEFLSQLGILSPGIKTLFPSHFAFRYSRLFKFWLEGS